MFAWDDPSEVTSICSLIKEHETGSATSSSGKVSCRYTPECNLPNLGELWNECKIHRTNLVCSLRHKLKITVKQTRQKKNKPSFSSRTLQVPLLLCHASRFICSQFSERQTGTYHSIHGALRTCELGGGSGVSSNRGNGNQWRPLHHNQDPPCLHYRAEQLAALWTRGGGERRGVA